ncbi:NUDIX hydrolase [Oleiagrimonas soli]|uniref:GDP-mannose pyrophosphatase n=1 Tax=Oleiagrimonas soli TaxID=1543381 RepID=A0A099CU44_9GAMM|nr:NUDIX hydrolase [Oleiagrimonas soli]KGI77206.1 DNA mismatch repair protein MutT [Oleiagrimonas soli]MBB6185621.1 ADP-ribose pyrophosphatase [Oleiagrimonas soli]
MTRTDDDPQTRTLYRGRWLTLRQRGRWEFVERNNPGGATIIIAVTDEDKVLFVEQYREPIQQKTIEMPAGLIGDLEEHGDEDACLAAQRELEEETGYACERVSVIHTGPSSAGMSTEMMVFVRATGLRRTGPGGGDESEQIVVHEVPRQDAGAWLLRMSREGYSIDPKLFAGLWFLEHAEAFG